MLNESNLSVQLYTLRERLQSEPEAVLADLAEIGFKQVEPFSLTDFADTLAPLLPKHGLTAPTTHQMLIAIPEFGVESIDLDGVWDAADKLGVKTVICPASPRELWTSREGIQKVADALNAAAEQARTRGLEVGYHNHWWEIENPFDEGTGMDVLASMLADDVRLEIDTYWAQVGGTDVPALLQRLGDRVIALHLKDGDASQDPKKQVAVGKGQVPVLDFVEAATHMKYGVIELDDSEGDMTQAVRDSFAYLNGK